MKEERNRKLVLTYTPTWQTLGKKAVKEQVVQMKIPDLKKGLPRPINDPDWRIHAANTDPVTDQYVKHILDELNRHIGKLIDGAEFHVEEVKIKTTRSLKPRAIPHIKKQEAGQ